MMRAAVVVSLCLLPLAAQAQQADGGAAAPVTTLEGSTTSSTGSPAAPATSAELEAMKRDLLEQARREADERVAKAKEDMRNELRAELATQSSKMSWEDEWQEQKKKLELLEMDGYLRVRPTLLYNMDLGVGQNANGQYLFPRTILDPGITDVTQSRTLAWADMRGRLEPTLNISEDIRIRAQFDLFNNMILGSTPEVDPGSLDLMTMNQVTPGNAILLRRIWGEVNTPVGLLSFGRMGDHWGMGLFHNDGNCLDCDYGDSVDRIMFTAHLAGFYLMPILDYVSKGSTTSSTVNGIVLPQQGVVTDYTQEDDVNGPFDGPAVSLIAARRDTDKEAQRKLDNNDYVLNYGLYYSYRHQTYEDVGYSITNQQGIGICESNPSDALCSVNRSGYVHEPDVWAKFMNKRFKIEAEGAAVLGNLSSGAPESPVPALSGNGTTTLTGRNVGIAQFGGAVRGEVQFLDNALKVNLEYGVASGDSRTQLGTGQNYNLCNAQPVAGNGNNLACTVTSSTNFVFNPDYRIDDVLWREILGSVTDAMYVKPGARYTIVEGFDVFLYAVYSRAMFGANTPGNNPNLGVEIDPGVSYTSDDGFVASLHYGGLIPLSGLNSPPNSYHTGLTYDPSAAHSLRMMLAIKF